MKIKNMLTVLFTPAVWIQNYEYSEVWDKKLNELMSKDVFIKQTYCTARIGGYNVWIANHPYASFTIEDLGCRPSRITILKAKEKYIADMLNTNENKTN